MVQEIKDILQKALDNGIKLPIAFDSSAGEPSVTLWFAYIAFMVAIASIILLFLKDDPSKAAMAAISFFVICMVFYRLRKLDKVSIDLNDQQIELDGSDDASKKNN